MVLLESQNVTLGAPANAFTLSGVDNQMHSLDDYGKSKLLVIIFMCNHCPYVQAVWGRLVNLQKKYLGEAQFIGINSNHNPDYPEDSVEKMKEYYAKYEMNFPYLQDTDQIVARAYGAVCTPDIFVYDSNRKLVYHGRIDDNWEDEKAVTKHDLDEALQALISGQIPSSEQFPSMGCSIKWQS